MGNRYSPGCRCWCLFVLFFFPLNVLDEIWGVIESVSEGFLTSIWRYLDFHVIHAYAQGSIG